MTFSLLPDCLAGELGGTLQAIEEAVAAAEAAPSLTKAADALRRDAVHLPGAMRWLVRRVRAVHGNLTAVRGLCPGAVPRMRRGGGGVPGRAEDRGGAGGAARAVRGATGAAGAAVGFLP